MSEQENTKRGLRVIVCGGRTYSNQRYVWSTLDELSPSLIVHGTCLFGADELADQWALLRGVDLVRVPALWTNGRGAGPRRNKLMATLGIANALLAFPGGKGTESMIREARRAGLRVIDKRSEQST